MSAYNGSGTFVISGTGLPFVTGTTISSTVANQFNTDLATGLSTAITKDGQTTPTANIPLGSFKLTGVGTPTAAGDALIYSTDAAWVPTDASGAGLTLTINGAGYTKIGNMVHVWASITFPVTVDATQVTIGGLPATVKNTTAVGGGFGIYGLSGDFGKFTANAVTLKAFTSAGASRPNSGYSAGTIFFQGWYPAA